MPAIEKGYRANFTTLLKAAKHGDLALLDCQDKVTGKPVRVVVAVNRIDGEFEFLPLAKLFDGDPYDELNPPDPNAGGGYAND